ncbi:GGDEF domain-containing protein [Treponema ruminis]|uniref:Diguanylate cyclase (GGDEF)-like protein n=1 Tax=Treponema ruminis TaxID=744515 RepID=A0A7W8G8V1_9SPIR|nr:GGDEF domain-containing protein [Treponema ruminis]MBB5225895.1 diguanylate cyclase (GGDEF)-like protein [Treponema ruminis]QSI03192.1 GGDEF domain-containing protein [Treponema ruminis]
MKRLALLVQDLDSDYFNFMLNGAKRYCDENGHRLYVYVIRGKNWTHGSFDYQLFSAVKLATKDNVDGILLATNTYCQYVPEEKREELVRDLCYLPLVSIGAKIPGLSSVVSENKLAFKEMLSHLVDVHHKKSIMLMLPKCSSVDIISRYESYLEFLKERGIPFDENKVVYADYIYEEAKDKIFKICSGKKADELWFDAIVTCSDDLAFGCLSALQELGISVPEEIAVTGFDNQYRCNYSFPSLSSIDQQMELQAYSAAALLVKKIENPLAEPEEISVPSLPVYRKSCGCPATRKGKILFNEEILLLRRKENLAHFHFFLQEMQASLSLDEFKAQLIWHLREYGIKSCVICLYDDPIYYERKDDFVLPDSARVLLAYNKDGVKTELERTKLDPHTEMSPKNFEFEPGKMIVVMSLFNTSFQYGYVLYTPGDVESRMHELLFSVTGIALASNRVLSLKDYETKRLASENQDLELASVTDALTGVLNRGGFIKFAEKAIEESLKKGMGGAVIYGDMDRLKLINDQFGHEMGDLAIKAEVGIFKKILAESDLIGRLGGDEFAMLVPGLDECGFVRLIRQLEYETQKYNETSSEPFKLSISLGVSYYSEKDKCLCGLLKAADEKQYEIKRLHHQQAEKIQKNKKNA